ncbi:hypothetical protein TNCT_677451 [Trichonephila clavata]|uniref:Uncharacterized protein n=1 Tax=Trichonephila clavata TaxID=2740835 RepID=A0A8X6I0B2_TRICU|nr:hypothetical protein TNCT_677451 [Trichonephila clavata]
MTMQISSISVNASLYITSLNVIVRSLSSVRCRCNTSSVIEKHVVNTIAYSKRICIAVQFNAASVSIHSHWLSSSSKPSARHVSLYVGHCCPFTLRIS